MLVLSSSTNFLNRIVVRHVLTDSFSNRLRKGKGTQMKLKTLASYILSVSITISVAMPGFAADCTKTSVGFKPLTDLGTGNYKGFQGGLYANGSNLRPTASETAGIAQAKLIQPLNAAGQPSADGQIVLLGIGMSNALSEFSS